MEIYQPRIFFFCLAVSPQRLVIGQWCFSQEMLLYHLPSGSCAGQKPHWHWVQGQISVLINKNAFGFVGGMLSSFAHSKILSFSGANLIFAGANVATHFHGWVYQSHDHACVHLFLHGRFPFCRT